MTIPAHAANLQALCSTLGDDFISGPAPLASPAHLTGRHDTACQAACSRHVGGAPSDGQSGIERPEKEGGGGAAPPKLTGAERRERVLFYVGSEAEGAAWDPLDRGALFDERTQAAESARAVAALGYAVVVAGPMVESAEGTAADGVQYVHAEWVVLTSPPRRPGTPAICCVHAVLFLAFPTRAPVEVTVRAPLEDFYKGGTVRANVRRRVVCRGCRGHEAHPRCSSCSRSCPAETKVVQRRMGPMLINEEVQVPSEQLCREEVKTLHAVIERGAPAAAPPPLPPPSPPPPPSSLVTTVSTAALAATPPLAHPHPHPCCRAEEDTAVTFERSSEQSPGEALLGFKRRIRHLDGHEVLISPYLPTSPPISPYLPIILLHEGEVGVFTTQGHGVPSEYGALRVTLQIDFPSELTADERAFTANHFGLPADGGQR
ncbi:hypothetical protein EMIHUDRAFT_468895 [Emiliania huxleyi CCMP1516]|uniref:Uncharacterized protein n=2 Tax=Emiliania huxleyi TaxID=2903 RepID=A0A0D3JUX5_EMIH1|nr:hypothetical protein EMIHUDRAFT_468895 [Emiliania huxleyi CCMP1516]EOD27310.1 hypothetical protein EMIHUDRAFT_468895 [Emiliania huxleyi CCMP1516]|eukprot:XP_005779739.1 hypothetical protein EMIHUDRAFT_468895 [Emiliania huxleyi CCMP1516]